VAPAVRKALNDKIAALATLEGRSATQSDLIGALLEGVPVWQADLMLRAYIKQSAPSSGVTDSDAELLADEGERSST
jgi:hypothetical protein